MGQGRLERAAELRRRAATMLASAGWLSARDLYQDALVVYREEQEKAGEASCLTGLGDVARQLKEHEEAERLYGEALEVNRTAGEVLGEAEAKARLGDLHRVRESWPQAREALESARALFEQVGHRAGQARCLGLIGEVARQQGDEPASVLAHYKSARDLQMETGDLKGAAVTLTFMASYLKERGQSRPAAETFVQAAEIYDGLGLHHRARPFRAAARRLDPSLDIPDVAVPRDSWDDD